MKTLLLMVVCGLLAACVAPNYRQVESAGGGAYLLAQSPAQAVRLRYPVGYFDPLVDYGFYPWWSHAYYSPNFYPHYFSFWYPSWPGYYGGAHAAWHGINHFGYRQHRFQPFPGPPGTVPEEPEAGVPPWVVGPADPHYGRRGEIDSRDLYRNPAMVGHSGGAVASHPDRSAQNRGPTAAAPPYQPTVRSLLSPARSRPAFAPGPRADAPAPRSLGRSLEPSHRSASREPPHRDN
jgi:hypothetical protein